MEKIRIPTVKDFIEVTLDEMQEAYDRAYDARIAQEIEEAREKNDSSIG